jgi:hypothetical protein
MNSFKKYPVLKLRALLQSRITRFRCKNCISNDNAIISRQTLHILSSAQKISKASLQRDYSTGICCEKNFITRLSNPRTTRAPQYQKALLKRPCAHKAAAAAASDQVNTHIIILVNSVCASNL